MEEVIMEYALPVWCRVRIMTDSLHFVIILSISTGLFAMGSSVKQMFEILPSEGRLQIGGLRNTHFLEPSSRFSSKMG
jgi:hypothetical protein